MSRETQLPAIPNSSDPSVKALKEATEVRLGRRGDPLDRGLTVRDLYENGVINVSGLPDLSVGGGSGGLPIRPRPIIGDTSPPPAPVNFTAVGGFTGILVSWGKPPRKDLTAHIYRNTVDDISTAVFIAVSVGQIFSDSVTHGSTYYYWVRFVSAAEVTGPFNATAGTVAVTSTINDAIPDATINVAKIANLVVDMASVTGTLTANQVSAGLITSNMVDAAGISANKITMDGNIEFANTQSGVQFGKTSLGDSQAGAFFGRSGGVAGFNISSSTSGIYADSIGTVSLNNVRIYTGSAGSALEHDIVGTYTSNLSPQSTSITIIVVGGGAGSQNNAAGGFWTYRQRVGNAGNPSSIQFMTGLNGTGSVISTYTAAGGAAQGYSVTANNGNYTGYAGQASSKAAGGAGGGPGGFASAGTRGSGGGGNGSTSNDLSTGGVQTYANAGTTVSQLVTKPSNAQSVRMNVGAGGTGGYWNYTHPNPQSDNYQVITVWGYAGGDGFVSIADPNSGGIEVDLLSILTRLNAAGI